MVESSTDPCDVPPFAQNDAVPGVLSWVTKKLTAGAGQVRHTGRGVIDVRHHSGHHGQHGPRFEIRDGERDPHWPAAARTVGYEDTFATRIET